MPGLFISFEGSEGCGKSTQVATLAQRLNESGREVVLTREPGGTPLGEAVRDLLKFNPAGRGMCPEAELLLFSASRAQLVRQVIRPALQRGATVITDRFHDSSTVYQGAARGIPGNLVQSAHAIALDGLLPDLTLVLDMPPETGRLRALRRPRPVGCPDDRMESEPPAFYQSVRDAFLDLARSEPERVRVIAADRPREEVAQSVWDSVAHALAATPAKPATHVDHRA